MTARDGWDLIVDEMSETEEQLREQQQRGRRDRERDERPAPALDREVRDKNERQVFEPGDVRDGGAEPVLSIAAGGPQHGADGGEDDDLEFALDERLHQRKERERRGGD